MLRAAQSAKAVAAVACYQSASSALDVHAESSDGEAKFWLDPEIELAKTYRLSDRDVRRIRDIIAEREQEIRDAWNRHFEN